MLVHHRSESVITTIHKSRPETIEISIDEIVSEIYQKRSEKVPDDTEMREIYQMVSIFRRMYSVKNVEKVEK
jgi:hypothetical protein